MYLASLRGQNIKTILITSIQRERVSERQKNIITPLRGVKVEPKKLGKIEELDSETTATRN